MNEYAAVLKDSQGNVIATGASAMDSTVIAEAERRSALAMRAPLDAVAERAYVDAYEAGQH
jgi:hypothetical protein